MQLPAHIENHLRKVADKRGYSEVEYIHYKEHLFKLATDFVAEKKRQIELKRRAA